MTLNFEHLRTIIDPTRTPDDFPVLREDFPPIDLDARQARIDADVESALRASMDAHPAGSGLCDDAGCGRPSPDGCRKCQGAAIIPFPSSTAVDEANGTERGEQ